MMKIKVIDLLNKIANGEDAPEKIKYEGQEYELQMSNDYLPYNNSFYLFENIFKGNEIGHILNNEVEIIKENKSIEKLKEIQENNCLSRYPNNKELMNKINELVKEVNKLKENK